MTLHIAVDGVCAGELVMQLYKHYKSKGYKVMVYSRDDIKGILYDYNWELSNYEKALLHALGECFLNTNLEKYDIVFWIDSIITDYLTLTDDNVTRYWLNQINKFCIKKDLYCYIKPTKNDNIPMDFHNIKNMLIINDNGSIEDNLKQLINQINEYFPHCSWCNNIYKKHNNNKYCSTTCRKLSRQKQNRDKVNRYNRRYRNSNPSNYHSNLGSEALLKQHPKTDFKKEHRIIINERNRLGV